MKSRRPTGGALLFRARLGAIVNDHHSGQGTLKASHLPVPPASFKFFQFYGEKGRHYGEPDLLKNRCVVVADGSAARIRYPSGELSPQLPRATAFALLPVLNPS